MIERYKTISIIYGGSGGKYAQALNDTINRYEEENRYPLSSRIVMESILTDDILTSVTRLFRETEICIAILTAEDCCINDGEKKYRLRQNVVFELGMALYKLGRERCILLGDFGAENRSVELPSDIDKLNITFFNEETREQVFNDVLKKILMLSHTAEDESDGSLRYDNLLCREEYYVDYGKLLSSYDHREGIRNNGYLQSLLQEWLDECGSLKYFDERLMHTAERVAFMPIFGKQEAVSNWYTKIEDVMGSFNKRDKIYYGNLKLLNFGKNTLEVVIRYTKQKMVYNLSHNLDSYDELLALLKLNPPPENETVNPLLEVLYFDYMGLIYMHRFDFSHSFEDLLEARKCYEKIANPNYMDRVDLDLSVWKGFLYYNRARLYSKIFENAGTFPSYGITITPDEILNAYAMSTTIRKRWLSRTDFNSTIQAALSYEYFIAKLDYIYQMKIMGIKNSAEINAEFSKVDGEIESYCNEDEKLERLVFVQEKLRTLRAEE